MNSYKDCYVNYKDKILIIGNKSVERTILFKDNLPINLSLLNKYMKGVINL